MCYKLVSVVIPTYNRDPSIIKGAIESVRKQTYKNIEIIIVDDNGEKNPLLSSEIQKSVNDIVGVRYVKHEKNQGACVARNTGIMEAQGEYIAFLDDDDIWLPDKIEKQVKFFDDSEVGLVYCGIRIIDENKNETIDHKAIIKKDVVVSLLKHNYIGSTSCGIARRDALIECGMFDVNLKSGQDQDMWIRLAQKYKVSSVEECLIEYKILDIPSISRTKMNRLESNIYLRKKYDYIFKKHIVLSFIMFLKIEKAYCVNGMYKEAFKYLFKSREQKNERRQ